MRGDDDGAGLGIVSDYVALERNCVMLIDETDEDGPAMTPLPTIDAVASRAAGGIEATARAGVLRHA